jgi:transcriptional regulator with XRE-family HTH domain
MKALTDYMRREGITQTELAKRLRVTPIQVNRWVRGKRSPNPDNLKHMAKRLGIPAAELL